MSTFVTDMLDSDGPPPPPSAPAEDQPRVLSTPVSSTDKVFRGVLYGAGSMVLVITGLIAVFLVVKAWPALSDSGFGFITTKEWLPGRHLFGIATLLPNGILIALIALVIAVPLAIAIAIFIAEYAPHPLRKVLIAVVDLMAAVPSIVWALWGVFWVQPNLLGTFRWMSEHLSWLPFFTVRGEHDPASFTSSPMLCGIVVSVTVVPIIASISREVFSQAPVGEREAAFALGASRWQMVRTVVLPFGKAGMIGATMLGFGRALGETIIVTLLSTPTADFSWRLLESGSTSIPSLIANRYPESTPEMIASLMAAGLALFVITLAFNTLSAVVISRSRSGAQTL